MLQEYWASTVIFIGIFLSVVTICAPNYRPSHVFFSPGCAKDIRI